MDIKVKGMPANDTQEIGSADVMDVDQDDLSRVEPPPHIAALAEKDIIDEGDANECLPPKRSLLVRGLKIIIAVSAVNLLLVLAYIGHMGSRKSAVTPANDTKALALSSAVVDDDVEDLTLEPDIVTTTDEAAAPAVAEEDAPVAPAPVVEENAPVAPAPEEVPASVGYDAEKCAAPKTDHEWLECASAAYAELRLEQKRLETRIAKLKSAPPARGPWEKPMIILFLVGFLLAIVGTVVDVVRYTQKSGRAAL